MCRLVAVIDRRGARARPLSGLIDTMRDTMRAGGPDDAGTAIYADGTVALAHRRLSIIELSPLGHQPMAAADQRYHIVFNGEIYNHNELRDELIALGHHFISHSDTEVLLASYRQWGADAFTKFHGMWACVIYDAHDHTIIACRDRLGVKPLYWYEHDNLIIIASELKAIYAHPDVARRIDPVGMRLFFHYNYIPAPYTICQHARKITPGTYVRLERNNTSTTTTYWSVAELSRQKELAISENEAVDELERLLRKSCAYRMVSDVPVGVFLSGGIDSSVVLALLAQSAKSSARQLKTFTIGFSGSGLDEAPYARAIAKVVGSEHYELNHDADAALSLVERLPHIWDEPFGDSSALPTLLVSQFARKHVTVALSADGGDELFGGYPKYWRSLDRARALANPFGFHRLRAQLPTSFMEGMGRQMGLGVNKLLKTKEIIRSTWSLPHAAFVIGQQSFTNHDVADLFIHPLPMGKTAFDQWDELGGDELNRMMAMDLLTYHVDDIHTKVDRATMAHGLEGREPLLDHDIIAFSQRVPSAYKIKDGSGKHLLKKVLYRHLDPALFDRPKMGFSAPIDRWMKKELAGLVADTLNETAINQAGIFAGTKIQQLRQAFARRSNDNTQKIWNVLAFEWWRTTWKFAL
jgi:asparagine synthase (glutamine-hydrolysing)